MLSLHFALQGLVNLVLFRIVVTPGADQVPQHIFIVRRDEILHRSAHQAADAAPKRGIVSGAERFRAGTDIGPAGVGGGARLLAHPEVGDHRLVKIPHFLLQVPPELVPLLPVAALHRLHVLHGGVVEVGGETLLDRLVLDLREDFRLLLGTVGLVGLFILFPQGGQHVAVLVGRGVGVHKRGNQEKGGGRKGCPDISEHNQLFSTGRISSTSIPISGTRAGPRRQRKRSRR